MRPDSADNGHTDEPQVGESGTKPDPAKDKKTNEAEDTLSARLDGDGERDGGRGKGATKVPEFSDNEPRVFASTPVGGAEEKKKDTPPAIAAETPPVPEPVVIPSQREVGMPSATGRAEVAHPGGGQSLLPKASRDELYERWQSLQLRFIDDPHTVASEAGGLVAERLGELNTALDRRKRELDAWNSEGTVDTERMRLAVRDYREFFDHVIEH